MNKGSNEKFALLSEVIKKIAGKNTEPILPILIKKKNINEFTIAEKLKLTINQTRNILYKLHAFNIVSFTRKKDKRKGWYIYFWTIDEPRALQTLKDIKNKEIEKLEILLKNRQEKRFFVCPEDNIELNEENAMHHEFICPECGKLLELANNEKRIREIVNKIESIKRDINKIDAQLEILAPKQELKEKAKKKSRVKEKKVAGKKGKFKKKVVKKGKKKVKKKSIKKKGVKKVKKKVKKAMKKGKKKR